VVQATARAAARVVKVIVLPAGVPAVKAIVLPVGVLVVRESAHHVRPATDPLQQLLCSKGVRPGQE
jgi:hypothetical protein